MRTEQSKLNTGMRMESRGAVVGVDIGEGSGDFYEEISLRSRCRRAGPHRV